MRRLLVVLLALGAFGGAIAAWPRLGSGAGRLDAGQAVARSVASLKAHDASSARDLAMIAVQDEPGNAAAHVALAKAMLALEDGVGAEAEIQRSLDAGADARLMPPLRAQAFLLQGNEQKALAEAAKALPSFRADAMRTRAGALTRQGDWAGASAASNGAVRLAPRDPDNWVALARFRLAAGDMLGANAAAQRALGLDPGHLKGLLLRGELVRSQYGLLAALPWFEAALKRDLRDHATLIEYAATLGDAGRTIDALAATRRAIAARPASPQAFYLQSVIAARAGNIELARALLEKTGGAIDTLPGMLLLKGVLGVQSGDYEQAIGKLKALVDAQPMNLAARRLLAGAMLRGDSAADSINVLRPIAARTDADSYTLLLAARGLERVGDRGLAATMIDRSPVSALQSDTVFSVDDSLETLAAQADQHPDDPAALVLLLRGLYAKGDVTAALTRTQQIASRNPSIPAAQLLLGDALILAKRPDAAIAAYQRAADLRFDGATMLRLIEALERTGRNKEAANVLALFLSQNPMDATALRLSARSQLTSGNYEAAIDSLEQVRFQIGDGDATLNADLAHAYGGAGALDTAQEFAEAAYALTPADPITADALGWTLYLRGDLPHAAEVMRKAVGLAPANAALRWRLAQVYADLGNKAEAARLLQSALADARFGHRAEAVALLARMR